MPWVLAAAQGQLVATHISATAHLIAHQLQGLRSKREQKAVEHLRPEREARAELLPPASVMSSSPAAMVETPALSDRAAVAVQAARMEVAHQVARAMPMAAREEEEAPMEAPPVEMDRVVVARLAAITA